MVYARRGELLLELMIDALQSSALWIVPRHVGAPCLFTAVAAL